MSLFLERSPFRLSHVVLPIIYLILGAMVGYVAPIMWGSRPGKTELEMSKEAASTMGSQLISEHIVNSFTKAAHYMEKRGLFVIDYCDSGVGMTWSVLPNGNREISQSWSIHLQVPQNDMAKRKEVEDSFVVPMGPHNDRKLKIRKVSWKDPQTVEVEYEWILFHGMGHYQTTNFLRELRW